jgi:hypothetical protein
VDDVGNKLSYGIGVDTHDRLGRLRFQVDAARASRDTDLPRLDATVHWCL